MKYLTPFFSIILVFLPGIFAEGFAPGTLVKSAKGYMAIEQIFPGAKLVSKSVDELDIQTEVAQSHVSFSQLSVTITTDSSELIADALQSFYDVGCKRWKHAVDLRIDDVLATFLGEGVCVRDIRYEKKLNAFHTVSVHDFHTFYVTSDEILAHNMVYITTAETVSSAGITLTSIATGVGIVGSLIYNFFWETPPNKPCSSNTTLNSGDNEGPCWCGHICDVSCMCACGCVCSMRDRKQQNNLGYTYQNGKYQDDANYHHLNSTGNNKSGKSPAPKDGQKALDNSMQIKYTSVRRIGISCGQFVILDQTSVGIFHGHVRSWEELKSDKAFHAVLTEMTRQGWINNKGQILK